MLLTEVKHILFIKTHKNVRIKKEIRHKTFRCKYILITEVDISNTNIIRKMFFFIKVYKKEYINVHVNVYTNEVNGFFILKF